MFYSRVTDIRFDTFRFPQNTRFLDTYDEKLDELLKNLESKSFSRFYRDSEKTIVLTKATYDGLRRAPEDGYKWFPDWLSKDLIF
jgi:hypothetical protein